ncbi:uncharacterized protein TNCT_195761 [Trichonephila clavata]|uniref:Kynurenine 3-monooxygenase n=1 Tax=Trichonephila clavata TaxID=2740835 RepID=A0A8X6JN33_TRICU|nr:uncharacterized protein TNCT_195761 [Trichonephila clavata]
MKSIVIVGSGPVGSFMAVLCRLLRLEVTVYEKRKEYTRNINLKIDGDLFKEVQEALTRLNVESNFFAEFYKYLRRQKDRILIKDLEEKFSEEAKSLGAKYVFEEVTNVWNLKVNHRAEDVLILDCTGRNSKLRETMFGSDEANLINTPLQNAMYINFKSKFASHTSLYQVMKNVPSIKLTEAVVSKNKDADGFANVTIPVFITMKLARCFDTEFPDINRKPINPFKVSTPVSDTIFFPISSIIGNLLVDDCYIDLNSVNVKKIVISCGYAKARSKSYFICLGDAAAYLAFFRSLNIGLKHAFELFIHLSMFTKEITPSVDYDDLMKQFTYNNPHLNPIKVYPSRSRNVFFIITKVLWYGCFIFCTTNQTTTRLTDVTGRTEREIYALISKYNERFTSWDYALKNFEEKREEDIQSEISSNKLKNLSFEFASLFIDINGKSIFKISEVLREVTGKHSLYRKDFDFFLECFKIRRYHSGCSEINSNTAVTIIHSMLKYMGKNSSPILNTLKGYCDDEELSSDEKLERIEFAIDNKFEESKLKLDLDTVEKTIGLWPKLIGLRFDSSEVRSNILSILIRNELRGCMRFCSHFARTSHGNVAGTSNFNALQRNDNFHSDKNILQSNKPAIGIFQNALKKNGRFPSQPNLFKKSKNNNEEHHQLIYDS